MLKIERKKLVLLSIVTFLLVPQLTFASANIDFGKVDISRADSSKEKQKFSYQAREGDEVKDVIKVKNSANKPIDFALVAQDSKIDNDEYFILKGKNEMNTDIGSWISFSEGKFTLNPGETKEIPFRIQIPTNADVGIHRGGILVERFLSTEEGLGLNLQQGVPVVVEIKGAPVTKAEILSQELKESGDYYNVYYAIQNNGNKTLDASVRLVVQNFLSSGEKVYNQNAVLARGASGYMQFNWEKPLFGFYNVKAELVDNATGSVLDISNQQNFVFLAYLEMAILAAIILLFIFRKPILKWLYSLANKKNVNRVIAVFLVAAMLSYFEYRFPVASQDLNTSVLISDISADENISGDYYMFIRWGHLTEDLADRSDVHMDAQVALTGATMQVSHKYSFDEDDNYRIRNADQVLDLNSKVKDDYDALLLSVSSNQNKAFSVAFEDNVRNLVSVYSIAELSKGVTVEAQRGSAYTFGKAEMKLFKNLSEVDSYLESEKIKVPSGSPDVLLNFNSATPDLDTSKVLNKEDTLAVLKNILSENSATPDVDSSLKLNSDFVEEIVKSDVGSEILASKQFIADLLASPAVLAALAATAQANVVFLPADTIVFPKQSFSFEDRKIASKVIGTLVFIHKKDKPWNAYVSSSDFEILSGGERVPASNLSVVPGPIIPINDSEISSEEIQRGEKHRLQDDGDQAVLVTTDSDKDAMFIMRPRLELILPASTRAGVYRGTLTITYIDRQ